jgi:glutamate dehydrogenase/leucine dehydrogenase
MQELGATMVGVSDAFGAIRSDEGIDAEALVEHMQSDGGKLGAVMRRAFREVNARAEQDEVPLREAAFEVGIERVVEASRTRGYIS